MTFNQVLKALEDASLAPDIRAAAAVAIEAAMCVGGEQNLAVNVIIADLVTRKREHSELTRRALRECRRQGRRAGTVPYGYRAGPDGRTLVPCEQEAEIVRVAQDYRALGYSFRKTAEVLNALGYHTRAGSPWCHKYVVSLLRTAKRNHNCYRAQERERGA